MLEPEELKIRFVKDLRFYANAICLYWINEIHIDESMKNSPALNDIIEHEKKHYYLFVKAVKSNCFKRNLLFLYNNLWCAFDSLRLSLKYWQSFKTKLIGYLFCLSLLTFIVFYINKVMV